MKYAASSPNPPWKFLALVRDRQQTYFELYTAVLQLMAQHAQEQERFGSAAGQLRERKLLPTDNHLQATEKTDRAPQQPRGKYHIFPQTEKTQLR